MPFVLFDTIDEIIVDIACYERWFQITFICHYQIETILEELQPYKGYDIDKFIEMKIYTKSINLMFFMCEMDSVHFNITVKMWKRESVWRNLFVIRHKKIFPTGKNVKCRKGALVIANEISGGHAAISR